MTFQPQQAFTTKPGVRRDSGAPRKVAPAISTSNTQKKSFTAWLLLLQGRL